MQGGKKHNTIMQKNNLNVKTLNVTEKGFFMRWLEFLKPYHGLRQKEIELLSLFLYKRYQLEKVIKDEKILSKILFDTESRNEIRDALNYSSSQILNNMISNLRSKGVIGKDNAIAKGLIPNLTGDNFKLLFNFNIAPDEVRQETEEDSQKTS